MFVGRRPSRALTAMGTPAAAFSFAPACFAGGVPPGSPGAAAQNPGLGFSCNYAVSERDGGAALRAPRAAFLAPRWATSGESGEVPSTSGRHRWAPGCHGCRVPNPRRGSAQGGAFPERNAKEFPG